VIAALMLPSLILTDTALASRVAASADLVLWLTNAWSNVRGSIIDVSLLDDRG